MDIINEILYYCKQTEPAGALMLTGEWGIGKTYFINNVLSEDENIKNDFILIRVSLFGLETIEDIDNRVEKSYFNAWLAEKHIDIKSVSKLLNKLKPFENIVKDTNLEKFINIDFSKLVSIENKMNSKRVILIFDDLERFLSGNPDKLILVLGVINDYCENKKFNTIIIANEDQLEEENYKKFKEKIVCNTIKFHSDYNTVIENIIQNFSFNDSDNEGLYRKFLSNIKDTIIKIIDSDSDNRSHNIRSLKSVMNDFFRVFIKLNEMGIDNKEVYFYNFLCEILLSKSGIKDLSSGNIIKYFPFYNGKMKLNSLTKWIKTGEWDEEYIELEINTILRSQKELDPVNLIKNKNILNLEDDILNQGYDEYLNQAYQGQLEIDDYIRLIENISVARIYKIILPAQLNWNQLKKGFDISLTNKLSNHKGEQIMHTCLNETDKNKYSNEEWQMYEYIKKMIDRNRLGKLKNRSEYIRYCENNFSNSLLVYANVSLESFDREMQEKTFNGFINASNEDRNVFIQTFKSMWGPNLIDEKFNFNDSLKNLEVLRDKIMSYYTQNSIGVISTIHYNSLIKIIDQLILKIKNKIETKRK